MALEAFAVAVSSGLFIGGAGYLARSAVEIAELCDENRERSQTNRQALEVILEESDVGLDVEELDALEGVRGDR